MHCMKHDKTYFDRQLSGFIVNKTIYIYVQL